MKTRNAVPVVAAGSRLFATAGARASARFHLQTADLVEDALSARAVKRRDRRAPLLAGLAALVLAGAPLLLHAQLVADGGTTNVTTGINLLPADLVVGTNAGNTTLNILGPNGAVTNATGIIGFNAGAANNRAIISGPGSLWTNSQTLTIGRYGSFNTLLITNGGRVANSYGDIGYAYSATSNLVTVTGTNSLWTNSAELYVGDDGSANGLFISNGGTVANSFGIIGFTDGVTNNQVTVTGPGSLWTNSAELHVSRSGSGSQLVVSNGGSLLVTSLGSGTLDVRRGTNVLNAGLIEADRLLLTNGAQSVFTFNGGTLRTPGGTIDNL